MAEFITDRDVRVLEKLTRVFAGRNIIGQARVNLSGEDADLVVETLRRVALRVREFGSWYPQGVPAPVDQPTPDASE